jgi:RimJ/RimL family protein N-acetyltransferase
VCAVKLAFPEPLLQSEAITLRRLRDDDAPAIAAACRDPTIVQFTFMPDSLTEEDARTWIDNKVGRWGSDCCFAITDSQSDDLVGTAGMAVYDAFQTGELYYWVLPPARGRGVASTAVSLICDWAFAHQLERLFLLVHPENEASHRVAARCGFTREGTLRAYERVKGRRPDLVSWSLLPNDQRPWHRSAR